MSLILEALNRSEAERQRGRQAQYLHPAEAPRPASRSLWIGLLLALLVVLTGLAFWWYSSRDADSSTELMQPQPAVTNPAGPQPVDSAAVSLPDPVRIPSIPAVENNSPVSAPESIPADPQAAVMQPGEVEPATDSPATGRPEPAAELPSMEPDPAPVIAAPVTPVRVSEPTPDPVHIELPARQPAEQRAPQLPALPTLTQLPAEVRREVGELTLNIHVFDEQPENRFVLINLRRYREGDNIGEQLSIQHIRPDGVALVLRGQAFLLPSGH